METQQIQKEIEDLKRTVEEMKQTAREHAHNGYEGGRVSFADLYSTIKTITVAGDLTRTLAETPRKVSEQILIDTTTGTKKLYVYDMVGKIWRSVTIA